MLGTIKNIVMLALSLLVTACASNKLDVISTSPIVAFNQAQVDEAINNANWSADLKVGETSLDEEPFLKFYTLFFGLDDVRPHRALAVGYPYECGKTNSVYGRTSETSAARAALSAVLRSARTMAAHSGKKCGARLVLLDNKLLIRPDELPDAVNTAYVLNGKSPDGTEEVVYGIFQHQGTGKNLPFVALDNNGEKICEGIYSLSILQAFLGSGKFKANCTGDEFGGELEGDFDFTNNILVSKGQLSGGGNYEFFVGMTINAYQARSGQISASQLSRYMADASNSVLLDFNTLHDGQKPKNNMVIDAYYAATGVTFVKMNSTDRQGPVILTFGGNACRYGSPLVGDRSRATPPDNDPFNVRIEFSIPVRSVSADVFAGATIASSEKLADGSTRLVISLETGATMTAYDSQGNLLDSIESRYEGFAKGRMGISSDTSIAAVEWISSDGLRSSVGIDNLTFGPIPNGQERTHIPPSKPVNEVVFVNGKMGCQAIQG